jgi:membrane associated rhomboid family serine protease
MTSASVGFHCPECTREGSKSANAAVRRVHRQSQPYVTMVLVALGVAVFVVDQFWKTTFQFSDGRSAEVSVLAWEGQLFGPNVAAGDWWRPITVGFVHDNLMHVGFNMFLLYMLGQLLEPALGRLRFISLFLASLFGGSLLILLIDPDQRTVGASGAVFGLMGAAFLGMRSRGINPFSTAIGPLLVMNLVITFLIPNISIAGHIGGLAGGAAAGWVLFELAPRISNGKLVTTLLCFGGAGVLYYLCLTIPETALVILPSAF